MQVQGSWSLRVRRPSGSWEGLDQILESDAGGRSGRPLVGVDVILTRVARDSKLLAGGEGEGDTSAGQATRHLEAGTA